MTLENLRDKIENKDIAAFVDKREDICYIPDLAESLEECFNYQELLDTCTKWLQDNKWYVAHPETLTEHLFYNIDWEFPSTWLEGLTGENSN